MDGPLDEIFQHRLKRSKIFKSPCNERIKLFRAYIISFKSNNM